MGFSSCSMQSQQLHTGWRAALVARQHVESFWTRDRTQVPLHLQVESHPLYHQGSPSNAILNEVGCGG